MLNKLIPSTAPKSLVRLAVRDPMLAERLTGLLVSTGRFQIAPAVDRYTGPATAGRIGIASLDILQIDPNSPDDLDALEARYAANPASPVIVLADGLGETAVRRLLKLQIADYLSTSCTEREFLAACEQAVRPANAPAVESAHVTTFVSAVGGAGASTLSLAAASVLARSGSLGITASCAVDLNFDSGALAEYLNVTPNLQLEEIASFPDRLDRQLLEVMLSRHASGLALLAAPQSTEPGHLPAIPADIVGRLLDLASSHFKHVVIDIPHLLLPLYANVVRGTDTVYVVTELTVVGLRQALRLADTLDQSFRASASVIVNKAPWLGGAVKKSDARQVLGDRLAGFICEDKGLVREAQNRGLLISQVKRRNRIDSELRHILLQEGGTLHQLGGRQK